MLKTIYSNLKNHDCDLCSGPLDDVIKYVLVTTENGHRLELHKECSDLAIETTKNKSHKLCSIETFIVNMKHKFNFPEIINKILDAYNQSI